jgi:hypothetical protein
MDLMKGFEHLLSPDEVSDMLDEIASADPPSFLRRCFAEGCSSPRLSWARARELALCAVVLDSIINDRDYGLEPELIADWRLHYAQACSHMRDLAVSALRRAQEIASPPGPDAASELAELERRLAHA